MSFCCVPKPKSRLSTVHARSRLSSLPYIENLRLLMPCLRLKNITHKRCMFAGLLIVPNTTLSKKLQATNVVARCESD
jgi:hypothetical protein